MSTRVQCAGASPLLPPSRRQGLTGTERERNIAGRVRLTRPVSGEVLLVDDIVTTGATACEAVRTLHTAGAKVTAVLTLAHA